MEPTRRAEPDPGFLAGVREHCDRSGAVMVLDEITAGWRLHLGGAHLRYGLAPDVAVFAKALGNGHPIAAVIGRAAVMQAAQESFISSTYWTEGVGPAAALAAIRKMRSADVPRHVEAIGSRFQEGLREIAARAGVPLSAGGRPALVSIPFDHPRAAALGHLADRPHARPRHPRRQRFHPSLAHGDEHVDRYLAAAEEIFPELAEAIDRDDVEQRIGGPVRHSGLRGWRKLPCHQARRTDSTSRRAVLRKISSTPLRGRPRRRHARASPATLRSG